MTLNEAYREIKGRLKAAGIDDPAFDAACILLKHTGVPREKLPLCGNDEARVGAEFFRDAERRAAGEPLQYILGRWEFMGLSFAVGPGVLIPRQETELLVRTAAESLRDKAQPRLLDMCAGSGCVAAAAASLVPRLSAVCVELSEDALRYLSLNIRSLHLEGRVSALRGDMLSRDFAAGFAAGSFDAITCNPPYIRSGDINSLQREVRCHEPPAALDGGDDGLRFYRAFAPWVRLLAGGGLAAFEVGAGQAEDAAQILSGFGLMRVFVRDDLEGIGRVVGGFAPGR